MLSPWLRRYVFITAAITGAAIMIVEILGAKMLSPYVGTSHFVWTAQIAVTLVALAAGYAAGGWIVDRSQRLAWIYGAILLAAGYLCLSVLIMEKAAFFCLRFELAAGSLVASTILFFPPLCLLAMAGPFFARVLTVTVSTVGANVGRLTSVSTLGSVAGTVLVGYVVIPLLPNSLTMYLTACLLMVTSLVYVVIWERGGIPPAVAGAAVAVGTGFFGVIQSTLIDPEYLKELYRGNSSFGLLQVVETKGGGRRYYLNDLLTQNTYDPESKRSQSLFTYMLHELALAYTPEVKDVLCIGMGVGIVPMQLAREGVNVDVVEINPAVTPVAARFFDFQPDLVNLTIGDGRYHLNKSRKLYDAIVLDAFLGESPPSHLMTREALEAASRRLLPSGTLVMNTFGEFQAGRDFFCASVEKTLRAVFASVRVHSCGGGNVFFVASNNAELRVLRQPNLSGMPFDIQNMAEMAFANPMHTIPEHGRVLRDDYNPVEFYDAVNREELRRRLAMSYRPD